MTLKLGVAGTGAIGRYVAEVVGRGQVDGFALSGVATRRQSSLDALNASLGMAVPAMDFHEMAETCDWVLEALPPNLFEDLARPVLSNGKTLLVLSCSQLLNRQDLLDLAAQNDARILVPSGAMLGLDAIRAVAVGEIASVVVETRKPVAGLQKAPYVRNSGLDLSALTEPTRILAGSVNEVAREFPANVNVAAAVSLAGIGPDRTKMEVWADPGLTTNQHSVRVTSDSSDFSFSIQNRPSDENPATGRITPQSVIALLRRQSATLQVGT